MSETDPAKLLDEFFNLDPINLTAEHLDAGIERFRQARAQFNLGKKDAGAPKKVKEKLDLATLEID